MLVIVFVIFIAYEILSNPCFLAPFGCTTGKTVFWAKDSGCVYLSRLNCTADTTTIAVEYDTDSDGNINSADNLQKLMENFYGCAEGDQECTRDICGCPT